MTKGEGQKLTKNHRIWLNIGMYMGDEQGSNMNS